jgi:hypothetical protein
LAQSAPAFETVAIAACTSALRYAFNIFRHRLITSMM